MIVQTTRAPRRRVGLERGEPCRRRRLAEEPLLACERPPGGDDLVVARRSPPRRPRRRRPRRARARRSGSRVASVVRAIGGLSGDEPRRDAQLREPLRVRGGVAAAAVREVEGVRSAAELLDDLEDGRLLALAPVRVERVDERVRAAGRQLARRGERIVEAAVHLEHARPERARLGELAAGHGAARLQHHGRDAGAGRVGRGRGGRVPGRGADHGAGALLERLRDGDRHPTVLVAARRVRALPLEPDLAAEPSGETGRREQRRRALAERDDGRRGADGQALAVALDQRYVRSHVWDRTTDATPSRARRRPGRRSHAAPSACRGSRAAPRCRRARPGCGRWRPRA